MISKPNNKRSSAFRQLKKGFSLLLFLAGLTSYGQSFTDNPTQIREIPTTPTMWEFEKYGNYPVSMHTGVPNISIPLMTASSGQIEVPVSLSYHASGIKVDEKASWVGLGWSLMAGGAITRTVRGSVDEWNKGYIDYTYYNPGDFDPAYGNNYNEMEEMLQGFIDTEPDIFQYNFMGYSGRFIFNHSTSRYTATISLIPHNDLIVVPTFSASGQDIISFTITTPEGFVAEFAYPERSSEYRVGLIGSLSVAAYTTWHLKKITSPNGVDEMTFEYKLVPGFNTSSPGMVIDERYSEREYVNYPDPCNTSQSTGIQGTISHNGVGFSGVKRLEKIIFNNGYLYFSSSSGNRQDDPDDEDLRLDQVQLYSSINGTNTLIRSFQFQYGYFGSINTSNSIPDEYEVRLKLTQVMEKGSNGASKNPYIFSYNNNLTIPERFSASQDHWGYYNGSGNASLVPSYTYQGPNNVYFGNANREVNHLFSKFAMLEKITYPTKGYTEFEFEGNKATITIAGTDEQYDAGGLRVKNIKNYDSDTSLQWQKSYEYVQPDNNSLSSGVYNGASGSFIDASDYVNGRTYYFSALQVGSCQANIYYQGYSTNSVSVSSSPTIANNLATVFYAYVKEYNGSVSSHEGYTWYQYDATKDTFVNGTGPIAFSVDRSWDRGQLLMEEVYENGNANPVKRVTYNWEEKTVRSPISAFKPGTRFDVESIGYVPPGAPAYSFRNNQYFLTYYSEPVIWKRLASKVTEENGIKLKESYYYDNEFDHSNLVKTRITDSRGNLRDTRFYYPVDVTSTSAMEGGSLSSAEYTAVNALKKNGSSPRVGQVLQKVILQNNKKTIERTNFEIWNGSMVLPTSLETAKGTASVDSRVAYHDYDNEGHLLEVSQTKGTHTYYVWGYNKQYPIAKIDNLSSSEIGTTIQNLINASVTASNADDSSADEDVLRSALASLRAGIPSAMVTTYTYDPLVGVTSITDPRGYTTYYQYDVFGRLEYIKDTDENLLSENKYHYKN